MKKLVSGKLAASVSITNVTNRFGGQWVFMCTLYFKNVLGQLFLINWFLLALKQLILMETKSEICRFFTSRMVLGFRVTWDRKTCQTWLRLPFLLQTPSWSPSWPGQNSWAGSGHMDLQPPASGEEDTQGEMLDCWTLWSFQSDTLCNLMGTKRVADLKVAKLVARTHRSLWVITCSVHMYTTTGLLTKCGHVKKRLTKLLHQNSKNHPLWWSLKYAQLIAWFDQTFCFFLRLILVQTFPNECVCSKLPHRKHVAKWDSIIWIQHTV